MVFLNNERSCLRDTYDIIELQKSLLMEQYLMRERLCFRENKVFFQLKKRRIML